MKKKLALAGLLLIAGALLVKAEKKKKDREPLRVVPSVDLARYTGLWYEVARLPNRFEEKCAADVTARYEQVGSSRLQVINQCRKHDGRLTKAVGEARVASRDGSNSRLKVRFAPGFLSFLPFVWGDYQIMALASDYSYALVGDESRKYLWILARTPQLDEATYRKLVAAAAAQGFEVSRLRRTKQG